MNIKSIWNKISSFISKLSGNRAKYLDEAIAITDTIKAMAELPLLRAFVEASPTKYDDLALAASIRALGWTDLVLKYLKEDEKAVVLTAITALLSKRMGAGTIQETLAATPVAYNEKVANN